MANIFVLTLMRMPQVLTDKYGTDCEFEIDLYHYSCLSVSMLLESLFIYLFKSCMLNECMNSCMNHE